MQQSDSITAFDLGRQVETTFRHFPAGDFIEIRRKDLLRGSVKTIVLSKMEYNALATFIANLPKEN